MTETEQFQKDLIDRFKEKNLKGVVIIFDGERAHYGYIGIGAGAAADLAENVKRDLLNKLITPVPGVVK